MNKPAIWLQKPILTFAEACLYCGLSKSRMYKHTSNNNIPFYKPEGKLIYFRKDELDAWLLRNRSASNAEIEREATKMAMV